MIKKVIAVAKFPQATNFHGFIVLNVIPECILPKRIFVFKIAESVFDKIFCTNNTESTIWSHISQWKAVGCKLTWNLIDFSVILKKDHKLSYTVIFT